MRFIENSLNGNQQRTIQTLGSYFDSHAAALVQCFLNHAGLVFGARAQNVAAAMPKQILGSGVFHPGAGLIDPFQPTGAVKNENAV